MIELSNTSMNLSMKSMKNINLQHNFIQYGVGSLLHLSRLSQLRVLGLKNDPCLMITHMLSLIRVHVRMLIHAVTLCVAEPKQQLCDPVHYYGGKSAFYRCYHKETFCCKYMPPVLCAFWAPRRLSICVSTFSFSQTHLHLFFDCAVNDSHVRAFLHNQPLHDLSLTEPVKTHVAGNVMRETIQRGGWTSASTEPWKPIMLSVPNKTPPEVFAFG